MFAGMFLQTVVGAAVVAIAAFFLATSAVPPPPAVYVFFALVAMWLVARLQAWRRYGPDVRVKLAPLGSESPPWLGRSTDDDRALYWRWLGAWLVRRFTGHPPVPQSPDLLQPRRGR